MADHLREQIMQAVVALLSSLPTTGANVYRDRFYTQDMAKLPSINILQSVDEPMDDRADEAMLNYIDRDLFFFVDAYAKQAGGSTNKTGIGLPVDATLNQIELEVVRALLLDYTLGLNAVINTTQRPTDEIEQLEPAEKKLAMMRMSFRIHYRTQRGDPSL